MAVFELASHALREPSDRGDCLDISMCSCTPASVVASVRPNAMGVVRTISAMGEQSTDPGHEHQPVERVTYVAAADAVWHRPLVR